MRLQEIQGSLLRIKAYNPQSGWLSADVRPDASDRTLGRQVTVVGKCLYEPFVGMGIVASGKLVTHERFGEQIEAEEMTLSPPSDRAARSAYLRHIAPDLTVQEAWLAAQFDGNLASELVPEIPAEKALALRTAWSKQIRDPKQLKYLRELGVPGTLAVQILKYFGPRGSDVRVVVADNPYVLMEAGIAFKLADEVALRSGMPQEAPERLVAGLAEAARRWTTGGHTVIDRENLRNETSKLLAAMPERVDEYIDIAADSGALILRKLRGGDRYQQPAIYETERSVAQDLRRLDQPLRRKNKPSTARITKICGFTPDAEQVEAIQRVFERSFSIITGGPGHGKTTITKVLVESFPGHSVLIAPTGMAAKRLSEVTGRHATTIHSFLEGTMDEDRWVFKYHRERPHALTNCLLIVDESSMVDTDLAAALFAAIPDGTTVVIVGDADQLPSVGPGAVLNDLIAAGAPTTRLKHIHRQGPSSPIPHLAQAIINGEPPPIPERGAARFIAVRSDRDPAEVFAVVRGMIEAGVTQEQLRVLAPVWRGPFGVDALNRGLQLIWNEEGVEAGGILGKKSEYDDGEIFEEHLYPGDRVLMTKNDHARKVFNGDILRVLDCGTHGKTRWLDARTDDGTDLRFEGTKEISRLRLAYVTTIHRALGQQVPHVVIALVEAHHKLLQRRVLYTAVTRAQRTLTVVGERQAIVSAAHDSGGVDTRETGLQELCLALAGQSALELAPA
jgi:exodeoxyribonuclease V alpha subunit